MESHGTIPEVKLKAWKIFSDVGPKGEKILKTAKLAHAHKNEGFVVTLDDQTYYFVRNDGGGGGQITRIPELCGVRVKEFLIGSVSLALTEDGGLYSWRSKASSIAVSLVWSSGPPTPLIFHPEALTGSLTGEKVMQVASSKGKFLALTLGGRVHNWVWKAVPTLIPQYTFDNKKVISVACSAHLNLAFAVNEYGKLFEWQWFESWPQKSALRTSSPIKKITASKSTILALTVDGTMQSWTFSSSTPLTVPVWTLVSSYTNVQDIATCVTEDVSVIELKTDTCLGRYVGNRAPWNAPFFTKATSLDESFAEICQTSYRTVLVAREPEPRKLCDYISTLWSTKKNADVTFSVEGKFVSAHKFILTMRSEYFEKMFSGEWAETEGLVVYIKDTKYGVFEALLYYMYHDRMISSQLGYENLFGLMKLADSYCDLTIRRECEKLLMGNININNVFFLLRNAASANALDLEGKVIKFVLDSRLLSSAGMSSARLVDLLGREAFDKLAMASLSQ